MSKPRRATASLPPVQGPIGPPLPLPLPRSTVFNIANIGNSDPDPLTSTTGSSTSTTASPTHSASTIAGAAATRTAGAGGGTMPPPGFGVSPGMMHWHKTYGGGAVFKDEPRGKQETQNRDREPQPRSSIPNASTMGSRETRPPTTSAAGPTAAAAVPPPPPQAEPMPDPPSPSARFLSPSNRRLPPPQPQAQPPPTLTRTNSSTSSTTSMPPPHLPHSHSHSYPLPRSYPSRSQDTPTQPKPCEYTPYVSPSIIPLQPPPAPGAVPGPAKGGMGGMGIKTAPHPDVHSHHVRRQVERVELEQEERRRSVPPRPRENGNEGSEGPRSPEIVRFTGHLGVEERGYERPLQAGRGAGAGAGAEGRDRQEREAGSGSSAANVNIRDPREGWEACCPWDRPPQPSIKEEVKGKGKGKVALSAVLDPSPPLQPQSQPQLGPAISPTLSPPLERQHTADDTSVLREKYEKLKRAYFDAIQGRDEATKQLQGMVVQNARLRREKDALLDQLAEHGIRLERPSSARTSSVSSAALPSPTAPTVTTSQPTDLSRPALALTSTQSSAQPDLPRASISPVTSTAPPAGGLGGNAYDRPPLPRPYSTPDARRSPAVDPTRPRPPLRSATTSSTNPSTNSSTNNNGGKGLWILPGVSEPVRSSETVLRTELAPGTGMNMRSETGVGTLPTRKASDGANKDRAGASHASAPLFASVPYGGGNVRSCAGGSYAEYAPEHRQEGALALLSPVNGMGRRSPPAGSAERPFDLMEEDEDVPPARLALPAVPPVSAPIRTTAPESAKPPALAPLPLPVTQLALLKAREAARAEQDAVGAQARGNQAPNFGPSLPAPADRGVPYGPPPSDASRYPQTGPASHQAPQYSQGSRPASGTPPGQEEQSQLMGNTNGKRQPMVRPENEWEQRYAKRARLSERDTSVTRPPSQATPPAGIDPGSRSEDDVQMQDVAGGRASPAGQEAAPVQHQWMGNDSTSPSGPSQANRVVPPSAAQGGPRSPYLLRPTTPHLPQTGSHSVGYNGAVSPEKETAVRQQEPGPPEQRYDPLPRTLPVMPQASHVPPKEKMTYGPPPPPSTMPLQRAPMNPPASRSVEDRQATDIRQQANTTRHSDDRNRARSPPVDLPVQGDSLPPAQPGAHAMYDTWRESAGQRPAYRDSAQAEVRVKQESPTVERFPFPFGVMTPRTEQGLSEPTPTQERPPPDLSVAPRHHPPMVLHTSPQPQSTPSAPSSVPVLPSYSQARANPANLPIPAGPEPTQPTRRRYMVSRVPSDRHIVAHPPAFQLGWEDIMMPSYSRAPIKHGGHNARRVQPPVMMVNPQPAASRDTRPSPSSATSAATNFNFQSNLPPPPQLPQQPTPQQQPQQQPAQQQPAQPQPAQQQPAQQQPSQQQPSQQQPSQQQPSQQQLPQSQPTQSQPPQPQRSIEEEYRAERDRTWERDRELEAERYPDLGRPPALSREEREAREASQAQGGPQTPTQPWSRQDEAERARLAKKGDGEGLMMGDWRFKGNREWEVHRSKPRRERDIKMEWHRGDLGSSSGGEGQSPRVSGSEEPMRPQERPQLERVPSGPGIVTPPGWWKPHEARPPPPERPVSRPTLSVSTTLSPIARRAATPAQPQPQHVQPASTTSTTSTPPVPIPRRLPSRYWVPVIPRRPDGAPILPLKIGKWELKSLGEIVIRDGYWNERHIWPVGFESEIKYLSMKDPRAEVFYTSRILASHPAFPRHQGPVFQVIPADQPGTPITRLSARDAWQEVAKHAARVRDKPPNPHVSGTEQFGLASAVTKYLIQGLPGAEQLRDKGYRWEDIAEDPKQNFGRVMPDIPHPPSNDTNDDYVPPQQEEEEDVTMN